MFLTNGLKAAKTGNSIDTPVQLQKFLHDMTLATWLCWALASQLLHTGGAAHTLAITVPRCGPWVRCAACQAAADSNALELADHK